MKTESIIHSKRYINKLKRWEEIMLDWRKSGMKQRVYCSTKQISYWSFKSWRSKLKREKLHDGLTSKDIPISNNGFIPLKVIEHQHLQPSKLNISSVISIKTRQGHEVKLSSDFSEEMMVKLLRAFRLADGG